MTAVPRPGFPHRVLRHAAAAARRVGPPPLTGPNAQWSAIASLDGQQPEVTDHLVSLCLRAAERARTVDLSVVGARSPSAEARRWVGQWPGEHYRLLAALVEVSGARLVVEVGTYTGLGALSLAALLPQEGRVVTYDVVDWRSFSETALRPDDFDGRIEQRLGDLSDQRFFDSQKELLAQADLILVDAPKDGHFEPALLRLLLPQLRKRGALLVFDDIRFLGMLQLWRDLPLPRLDMTSLGHWSGTGVAEVV